MQKITKEQSQKILDVVKILKKLKKSSYKSQINKIEQFSVEILEKLAVNLYEENLLNGIRNINGNDLDLLDEILSERVTKIQSCFEWTNEKKEKLLKVNDKFMQIFEKAHAEAIFAFNELDKRLKNNDDYVKNYDITIKISFFMGDEYYRHDFNSFGFILSEPISGFSPVEYFFGHSGTANLEKTPIYLDKESNWNIEYFNNKFNDNYICYAMHELMDTDKWSLDDIINIKKILADVEIKHQYFNENIQEIENEKHCAFNQKKQ